MEQETTTTLAGTELNRDAVYLVDWQSMKGVEDMVLIFASMGLSFSGRHPHFDTIKHLLDLSNPIVPNQPIPQQAEKRDFKLPQIKKIK
jgi:hypothetical protein